MAKAAQRQFLVKVHGVQGLFMTKTGGNVTSSSTKVYDGGSVTPDVIASPAEADNITVGRAFDRTRDGATVHKLRRQVGRWATTVTVTPTDRDLVAVGNPVVYPEALLVGFNEMDANAGSGDPAMWELVFAIGAFR